MATFRSRRAARATERAEVDELRAALRAAEARAEEAEQAMPALLALGRRTADALLQDARQRAEGLLVEARERAEAELGRQRRDVRREAKELEALRLAVAAEAMGLERIRAELQRRLSASAGELARLATDPTLLAGEPLRLEPVTVDELSRAPSTPRALPAATDDTVDLAAPSPRPRRFDEAWAAGEDPESEAAFDRFFSADVAAEPSRAWILAGDDVD